MRKQEMALMRVVKDVSTGAEYFCSEVFNEFLKNHFSELLEGETFIVLFEGKDKELFMSRDLQIFIRNPKGEELC